MPTNIAEPILERVLEPIGRCLNEEAARQLVDLRADPQWQRRIEYLADKCNEGTLSADERAEYELCVAASAVISILQAKARLRLAKPENTGSCATV
jgi:hypothetical protein